MSRVAAIRQVVDPAATFLDINLERTYALQLPELPRTPQCLSDRATVSLNEATSVTPHTNVTARRLLAAETEILVCTSASHGRVHRVRVDALHTSLPHWARSRTI